MRRSSKPAAPAIVSPHRVGDVTIDGAQLMIRHNGHSSWFTPVEWRLLCVFLRHPGAVLSREELAEQAWGVTDEEGPATVNVYISRIRRKLDPDAGRTGAGGRLIQTVRTQGYRMVLDAAGGVGDGAAEDSAAG